MYPCPIWFKTVENVDWRQLGIMISHTLRKRTITLSPVLSINSLRSFAVMVGLVFHI